MNILFTTLSTRSKNPHTCYYITDNCKDPEKKGKYDTWCSGIHQQEPGAKKFLAEEKIDRIVMFGSKETYNPEADEELLKPDLVLKDWVGQLNEMSVEEMNKLSSLRFLVCRLADFVYGNSEKNNFSEKTDSAYATDKVYHIHYQMLVKLTPSANPKENPISFVFIPDHTDSDTENLKSLINSLRGSDKKHTNHLFMDMQGGERTKIYVNNALLQLLSKQDDVYFAILERVVATQFDPWAVFDEEKNRIIDETNRYRIVDLVSGMNAFLKYGKSKQLTEYIENLKKETNFQVDRNVDNLIKCIKNVDYAITYCRIGDAEYGNSSGGTVFLKNAIEDLKTAIKNIKNAREIHKSNDVGYYFDILIDGIETDLGDLIIGDKPDAVALIEWCLKKENYVVATAIAEDGLPRFFVEHGILYYAKDEQELNNAKIYFMFRFLISDDKDTYIYRDINHFFIKTYLGDLNVYPRFSDEEKIETIDQFDCQKTKNLKNAIVNAKYHSFPLSLYTKDSICGEDTKKNNRTTMQNSTAVYRIILLYSFVAYYRNCLAHANNKSNINPEILGNALKELVKLLKHYRETGIQNDDKTINYFLPYNFISKEANHEKDLKKIKQLRGLEKDSIIIKEIKYELSNSDRKKPYGIMNYYIKDCQNAIKFKTKHNSYQYPKKYGYKNVYALSALLIPLIQLHNAFSSGFTSDVEKMETLIKDREFKGFAKLLINYYKNKTQDNTIHYDGFIKKHFKLSEEIDQKDVVAEIKRGLTTLDLIFDFAENHCSTKEQLENHYHEVERDLKIRNTTPEIEENRKQLQALFRPLGNKDYPDWKRIIIDFIQNDFETLRSILE